MTLTLLRQKPDRHVLLEEPVVQTRAVAQDFMGVVGDGAIFHIGEVATKGVGDTQDAGGVAPQSR